jgi:hypothetical protein
MYKPSSYPRNRQSDWVKRLSDVYVEITNTSVTDTRMLLIKYQT